MFSHCFQFCAVIVAVPDTKVIPIPDTISDASAAQFLVNPVTVWIIVWFTGLKFHSILIMTLSCMQVVGMLDSLGAPQGEFVIQTAAASTLGRQFITLAKLRGVKTINIVRRDAQIQELLDIGADFVINSETPDVDIVAEVDKITEGKKAWGAIDAVGGALTEAVQGSVRNGGNVFIYGALSGLQFTGSIVHALFRDVSIKGFWLSTWLASLSESQRLEVFSSIVGFLASGVLVPKTGKSFPLESVEEAIAHATSTARVGEDGKVILVSN